MLLPAILVEGFLRLMTGKAANAVETAQALSSTYSSYAATAQANGLPPLLIGLERVRMAQVLVQAFIPGSGSQLARSGIAMSIAAFWTGVVFGVGVFTYFPNSVLEDSLANTMRLGLSCEEAAQRLADCVDVATHASLVTFPPPIGPVPLV